MLGSLLWDSGVRNVLNFEDLGRRMISPAPKVVCGSIITYTIVALLR